MLPYEMIAPNVVVLVTVKDGDVFRSAPFSWVVPVSKEGHIGILMRVTSNTLRIIESSRKAVLSTVSMSPEAAQKIRLSRSPKGFNLDEEVLHGLWYPVPSIVNMSANANLVNVIQIGLGKMQYKMVVFSLGAVVIISDKKSLLFHKERKFADYSTFEVEGF